MLRLAVIGLKHGMAHVNNICKLNNRAKLVGVCARHKTPERITLTAELDIPFYMNYQQMIKDTNPDGVIISTPNHCHLEEALFCISRGIPILIEKPIADTVGHGVQIANAVDKTGVPTLLGYHRRFSPKLNLLKQTLSAGKIGTPIGASIIWTIHKPIEYFGTSATPSWQTKYELGGGPLMINASHEIDSLRYLFGDIDEVQGVSSNLIRNFNLEDSASISVKFKNGFIASLFISDCTPSLLSYENTVGENSFYQQYEENCCFFFGSDATLLFPSFELIEHPKVKGWQYPVTKSPAVDLNSLNLSEDPLLLEMEHFCSMLEKNTSPFITAQDGLKTLQVIDKIRKLF